MAAGFLVGAISLKPMLALSFSADKRPGLGGSSLHDIEDKSRLGFGRHGPQHTHKKL